MTVNVHALNLQFSEYKVVIVVAVVVIVVVDVIVVVVVGFKTEAHFYKFQNLVTIPRKLVYTIY